MDKDQKKLEKAFARWMQKQGYVDSTVQLTLRQLRSSMSYYNDTKQLAGGYLESAQRRFLAFYKETGTYEPCSRAFVRKLSRQLQPLVAAPNGPRKKPELNEGQWRTLGQALRRSEMPEDRMLYLFMLQSYGLKDFLTLPLSEILTEVDVRIVPWTRQVPVNKDLSSVLCKVSSKPFTCAQSRLRRRLQFWAADLDYDMDLRSLHKASVLQANRAA